MIDEGLVRSALAYPSEGFLCVIESARQAPSLSGFVRDHRPAIEQGLLDTGAILFRGFDVKIDEFARVADSISRDAVDYIGGNSPRREVRPGVYSSSELPPSVTILQHHEMQTATRWPMRVLFFCDTPPAVGGQTPLCHSRPFYRSLSKGLVETFEKRGGVIYVSNFRPGSPLRSLAATYGTEDPEVLRPLFSTLGIEADWKGQQWVQTRQRRPAVRRHPTTGEPTFVASPHIWHHRNWHHCYPELLARVEEPGTPEGAMDRHWMHVTYGDGTPIEEVVLDEITERYRSQRVMFDWQCGDVLVLDNLLVSHGRMPYSGNRNILAALRLEHQDGAIGGSGATA